MKLGSIKYDVSKLHGIYPKVKAINESAVGRVMKILIVIFIKYIKYINRSIPRVWIFGYEYC